MAGFAEPRQDGQVAPLESCSPASRRCLWEADFSPSPAEGGGSLARLTGVQLRPPRGRVVTRGDRCREGTREEPLQRVVGGLGKRGPRWAGSGPTCARCMCRSRCLRPASRRNRARISLRPRRPRSSLAASENRSPSGGDRLRARAGRGPDLRRACVLRVEPGRRRDPGGRLREALVLALHGRAVRGPRSRHRERPASGADLRGGVRGASPRSVGPCRARLWDLGLPGSVPVGSRLSGAVACPAARRSVAVHGGRRTAASGHLGDGADVRPSGRVHTRVPGATLLHRTDLDPDATPGVRQGPQGGVRLAGAGRGVALRRRRDAQAGWSLAGVSPSSRSTLRDPGPWGPVPAAPRARGTTTRPLAGTGGGHRDRSARWRA